MLVEELGVVGLDVPVEDLRVVGLDVLVEVPRVVAPGGLVEKEPIVVLREFRTRFKALGASALLGTCVARGVPG